MVNSVTEFLLTVSIAICALIIAQRFTSPLLRLNYPLLAVPTPPPKGF
ncbi:MAG: hypothetical protein NZM18_10970 [Thermoflexales bacterium]|nr:hypothetical protein [Thermoflexales bacterium]